MLIQKLTRVTSGIYGLDKHIENGLPFPSTILISGETGTGKTTCGLQFLFEGAKNHEQGLYFSTLSEPPQWLLKFVSRYKFIDIYCFGREIKLVDLAPLILENKSYKEIINYIDEEIAHTQPQRIVIDPVPVVGEYMSDLRKFAYELCIILKNWQAITFIIYELFDNRYYASEFAGTVDGIIVLYNLEINNKRKRFIEVLKMRGTKHTTYKLPATLAMNGFRVSK